MMEPIRSLSTRREPGCPVSAPLNANSSTVYALVLDIGEADHMGRRLALGVLTLVLLGIRNAFDTERLILLRISGLT